MPDPMPPERLAILRDAAATLRREGNPDAGREELIAEIDRLRTEAQFQGRELSRLRVDLQRSTEYANGLRSRLASALDQSEAIAANVARMLPVVEAAVAWRRAPSGDLRADRRLADAVDRREETA